MRTALIFASFVVVACLQSWPLPVHLATHLTGSPSGDTGVYVWNIWVFRHELVDVRSWPFTTSTVLGLPGPVDLSLHNYTVFANLLALPLQRGLGVVRAFNVVYLINVALAGLGAYLLARRAGRASGVRPIDAWLAGVLFACSPFLVARSTAHFSLVAAAPLPFFALCLDRAWDRRSGMDAAAAGACVAWATYADVYYGVYCGLLLAVYLAARTLSLPRTTNGRRPGWMPWIDIPWLAIAGVVALVKVVFDGALTIGEMHVSVHSLYTPVLVLTMLGLVRLFRTWPRRLEYASLPIRDLAGPAAMGIATAAVLLSPMLYGLATRAVSGEMVAPPVFWRSSAPGLDLLSFVLPNPNHPLAPSALVDWVARQPGRFEENVASIPWIALIVVVVAWRVAAYRPDRFWWLAFVASLALAVGPFVRIAGITTYVPGPWALLRYLPVLGQARMPTRFGVLVALAAAVLFAAALAAVGRRFPAHRRAITAVVAALLVMELTPVPRRLAAATVPDVFETIASDPRPLRVLTLPFGIRDGLSSIGDFNAESLLFQTRHGKPLVGGYLSRVSQARKDALLANPVLAALAVASDGQHLTHDERRAARKGAAAFLADAEVGWVVVDESRASPELQRVAIDLLRLEEVGRSDGFVVFVPDAGNAGSVGPGAADDTADDSHGTDD